MSEVVFRGVSPRSLGDLLKGYGLIAVLGERHPKARFWWDEAFHLVAELPDSAVVEDELADLPAWAEALAPRFQQTRQESCNKPLPCPVHPEEKAKGKKITCPVVLVAKTDSPLKSGAGHDELDPCQAKIARAVAVPRGQGDKAEPRSAEPHPLFPGYGQESSGNYFGQLAEAAQSARSAASDLAWSLYGRPDCPTQGAVDKGYLFFPEPTKRYATGIAKWEQEKSSVPAWCFLLAIRGALFLRGGRTRSRWRRAGNPAFPFVFAGSDVLEVHFPTWNADHPRTQAELLLQVHQFHVPLGRASLAATAAEFRAAVQRRGPAVGFDAFHRFVLERRRPGQKQPMPQAIPRGLTRTARARDGADLRRLIAPLGETGWIDQFTLPGRKDDNDRVCALHARSLLDQAIHRAVDEPVADSFLSVLETIWTVSRQLLLPGKLRRAFERKTRTPRPVPPLPAKGWERALSSLFERPEFRIARAIGAILGVRGNSGQAVGPVLEQLLPVRWRWDRHSWAIPERSSVCPWSGRTPLHDFQAVLWRRWLLSEGLPRLPFAAARAAPLADVVRLVRGDLDVEQIHRLVPLFALLGWSTGVEPRPTPFPLPVPAAYGALRLWFELGISPPRDRRPPRDGEVPRLVSLGGTAQIEAAVQRALDRLRVQGLPWHEGEAPTGKAVARAQPRVTSNEAGLMALAVMVPISRADTLALSRRFWVAVEEKEMPA